MTAERVVCLGDVMVDVLTRLAEPLHVGSDTPADVAWSGGGSAANTATWLAQAGVPTTFVGRVGADVPGEASLHALAGCGVRTEVTIDDAAATGTCVVLVDLSGERTMVPSPGANALLSIGDVDRADLGPADHLHVSGYALFGGARHAALYAIETAHRVGASVSIGAASAAPLAAVGARQFLAWADRATLFANRAEAAVLTGHDDPAAAAHALAVAAGAAIVTAGSDGAFWADGATDVFVPAAPVDGLVDTTGAGDAFVAGYLAARIRGESPDAALAHGHLLGAAACRLVGGRPAIAGR